MRPDADRKYHFVNTSVICDNHRPTVGNISLSIHTQTHTQKECHLGLGFQLMEPLLSRNPERMALLSILITLNAFSGIAFNPPSEQARQCTWHAFCGLTMKETSGNKPHEIFVLTFTGPKALRSFFAWETCRKRVRKMIIKKGKEGGFVYD